MSFAFTTDQIRARTKTVTRRLGWRFAQPGDLVQPVVKGQGLKKGERLERIGPPIRLLKVDRVALAGPTLTVEDVAREGYPGLSPRDFIDLFRRHNTCPRGVVVTRIEFEYVDE